MAQSTQTAVKPPQDYFSYHFAYALPKFISAQPEKLKDQISYLNFQGLLKNLFAPYKRLTANQKVTLTDRISFNITSRFVGASTRLLLLIFGLIFILLYAIFALIQIILYIPPIASLASFLSFQQNTFFDSDLKDPKKFLNKLIKTKFFQALKIFFDDEFLKITNSSPTPNTLGINSNQNINEIFSTLSTNFPNLKNYFSKNNIDLNELAILTQYLNHFYNNPAPNRKNPIGTSLVYGYTNTLDKYCQELTGKKVTNPYFNKTLVENLEKILTRAQANNVIMIGDVGVGRHSGIIDLASAIERREFPSLSSKRVLFMDTIALLGSSKNLLEIKARFENLLTEAKNAGNIILVIDYIDRISTSIDSRIDLSEVLNTTLVDNSLPIIGITTYDDFNKYLRVNPAFLKLFEKVEVAEPKKEEDLQILIGKVLESFSKNGISCTYQALLEIVDKSERLMAEKRQPEKSILLLEDGIARALKLNQKQVTLKIVDDILTERTSVPVGKIEMAELEKLKDLEGYLHKRIVGQDEAITSIAKAMRRARTGLEKTKRPMGSFLFLGPTGVGKTETAKALADAFFGTQAKMIRLDMAEYRDENSQKRLIGNVDTKTPGQLATLVRQNPYGLLLLDEFEKTNPYVQNLFLQILDEGNLTDAFAKKVSFTNIIIIATSNAGAEFVREQVATSRTLLDRQGESLSIKLLEYVLSQGLLNPELVNRFDATVVYQPLTSDEVMKVAKLMLNELANQIKDTKNITLEITDTLAKIVAEKGYNVQFGARPIRRLIQDKIEDGIAKMIIENKISNGGKIPSQTLLSFVN